MAATSIVVHKVVEALNLLSRMAESALVVLRQMPDTLAPGEGAYRHLRVDVSDDLTEAIITWPGQGWAFDGKDWEERRVPLLLVLRRYENRRPDGALIEWSRAEWVAYGERLRASRVKAEARAAAKVRRLERKEAARLAKEARPARDQAMYRAWLAGETYAELGRRHGMTSAGARERVWHEGRRIRHRAWRLGNPLKLETWSGGDDAGLYGLTYTYELGGEVLPAVTGEAL